VAGTRVDEAARIGQICSILMSTCQRFACIVGLLGGLTAACATAPASLTQSPLPQGISVNGHGEARGEPDIARITLGVETRARLAAEATEQATRQMSAVIAAIKQLRVADADVRTQNFSINFEQQPEPYPQVLETPARPSGPAAAEPAPAASAELELPRGFYRVSNTVQITVRDLDQLGAILGATTGAGANNVWGIQFEIEDPSALEAAARQAAVTEATSRAEQLARLAGVELGNLISVGDVRSGAPSSSDGFAFSMRGAQADVPVQRGELTVGQDVQMVFSIGER
jgi:uncharacterized protein